jgi:hypothetical protein
MLSLDPVTRAEYDAAETPAARAAVVMAAITGTVTATVYDGSDVARGSGTMQTPWATIVGTKLVIGELQDFLVTNGGTPDANWYLAFESGTRWLRGPFGLTADAWADFKWSLPAFATGQRGRLGTVYAQPQGITAVDPQPYVAEWSIENESYPVMQWLTVPNISLSSGQSFFLEPYVVGGEPPYKDFHVSEGLLPDGVTLDGPSGEVRASQIGSSETVAGVVFGASDSEIVVDPEPPIGPIEKTFTFGWVVYGEVDVPVTPEGYPEQFLTLDSANGTMGSRWSLAAQLFWKNQPSGDWMDANGTQQGAVPYIESSTITATGPVNMEVAPLVQKWIDNGANRGFFLKAAGTEFSFGFGGRLADNVDARPTLAVVTTDGTFNPPPRATAYWVTTLSGTRDGRKQFYVQQGTYHSIVQFDMSGVTGTVLSAQLRLVCDKWSRNGRLQVFEADPPTYTLCDDIAANGLAAAYPEDSGIASHPSVMFTSDFTTFAGWSDVKNIVPWNVSEKLIDPQTGLPFVRAYTPEGELSVFGLNKFLMTPNGYGGEPLNVVEEAYVRWYQMIESDYISHVEVTKAPGFDCRMGYGLANGNWNNTVDGGNSGSPPTGLHYIDSSGRHRYSCGMMRGHIGRYMSEDPYRDLTFLRGYIYHLDQQVNYGDSPRWGTSMIERQKWYSYEQRIKMNSLTGPEDEFGNREAVADGIYEIWVGGVKRYSSTTMRYRRHPQIGVCAFDMSMYHGGSGRAPFDLHYRWAHVVVASEYIGPMKGGWNPNP